MKGSAKLWFGCGVLLAASLSASTAQAQFLSGGAYGLGFFDYGSPYVYQQRIPYYALYPPVYYSYPVARTYGYSPFAYPPGTVTPAVRPKVESAMYHNPYVPRKTQPAAATDKSVEARRSGDVERSAAVERPVRVAATYINPFVQQARAASNVTLTGLHE
jgi:hypothetical protein